MSPFLLVLVLLGSEGNDLDLEVTTNVVVGQEPPALVLKPNAAISTLRVTVQRPGGKSISKAFGPSAPGNDLRITLPSPVGRWRYQGKLEVLFASGTQGEIPLDFEVEVLSPLEVLVVDHETVDLGAGKVELTANRPLQRCAIDAELDDGGHRRAAVDFAPHQAGTRLPVALPIDATDVVLRVTFVCHDTFGTDGGRQLLPWKLDVPHEDVNFDPGDSVIGATEQNKLDRAFAAVSGTLRRYGDGRVTFALYIIGHTDTVGDAASNQRLSVDRARAIAAALRQRGVRLAIHYTGFGENEPRVATADETDEPRNRRAEYVLAVREPRPAAWKRL